MTIIECNRCGKHIVHDLARINGYVGIVTLQRSLDVDTYHHEEGDLCMDCYKWLCEELHFRGGK